MIRLSFSCCVVFLASAGIGCMQAPDGASHPDETAYGALSNGRSASVELLYASVEQESWCPRAEDQCTHLEAGILVQNLAYQKQVVIAFRAAGGPWMEVSARFVGPASQGREVWRADTHLGFPHYLPVLAPGQGVELAVRYVVKDKEYWDNNDQQNYFVSADGSPFRRGAILARGANVVLSSAALSSSKAGTFFLGRLLVRNLTPEKHVRFVYTTDNWATNHIVDAQYVGGATDANDAELWSIDVPATAGQTYTFAVAYEAGGKTYWDNNFGMNYTAR